MPAPQRAPGQGHRARDFRGERAGAQVDKHLVQIDKRFEQINEQFGQIDEQFGQMEGMIWRAAFTVAGTLLAALAIAVAILLAAG